MSNGGGFFGGFAEGFASTYGRRKQSLSDALGVQRLDLDKEKFAASQEQAAKRNALAEKQFQLQQDQAESLNAHREWLQLKGQKEQELALRNQDLDIASKLVGLLDSKYSPGARKAGIRMFAMALGVDPKNPQFTAMTDMVSNLSEEEAEAFRGYIADMAPNATPGQVKAIIQQMFTDPDAALSMVQQIAEGPDVNMTSVVDPNDPDSNIYVRDEEAIGMTPAPSGQYMTAGETLRLEEGKMILANDNERYKALVEKSDRSKALMEDLDAFRAGLESETFTTGPAAGVRYAFGNIVKFLGLEDRIDLDAFASGGTAAAEVMNTSGANIVAGLAEQLGRTTNMQLTFLQDTVMNLMKSPEGNAIILELMTRSNKRTILAAQEAERYINEYGTFRPKGQPTLWDSISRIEMANPIIDDDIRERMTTTSEKNVGIDIEKLLFGDPDAEPAKTPRCSALVEDRT